MNLLKLRIENTFNFIVKAVFKLSTQWFSQLFFPGKNLCIPHCFLNIPFGDELLTITAFCKLPLQRRQYVFISANEGPCSAFLSFSTTMKIDGFLHFLHRQLFYSFSIYTYPLPDSSRSNMP